jgi:hypothetical protein
MDSPLTCTHIIALRKPKVAISLLLNLEGTSNLFLDKSASLKHGQSTRMYVYHRCHLAFPFERDQRERERERERERWEGFGVSFASQVTYLRACAGSLRLPRSSRSQSLWPKTPPFMAAQGFSRSSQVCYTLHFFCLCSFF